jgi:phosphatidylcholine synthase
MRRAQAFIAIGVHVLTLSGAVLSLAAIISASSQDWPRTFTLLGLALIVDGLDGPLARRFNVAEVLPRFQGATLDLIVDYLGYVFVPAYIVYSANLMPAGLGLAAAAVICVTSGFYFADRDSKTPDQFFRGFPALWNLVVFHIIALAVSPPLALLLVGSCAAATFLPVTFVHPLRVVRWRAATLTVTLIWAALAVLSVVQNMQPDLWVRLGLLVTASYYLVLTAWRSARS